MAFESLKVLLEVVIAGMNPAGLEDPAVAPFPTFRRAS